ncbi:MAG: class I SAM-dependent methyltransferase [Pyrinomonadaceae bacterium]
MSATQYDSYVRAEWTLFRADPSRWSDSLGAVSGLEIRRVLDVGCGAGQELLPFVVDKKSLGIGVDLSPEVGASGRTLYSQSHPDARVSFANARAEALPFVSSSFDVVICRVALPYMNNAHALAEIARVTRGGGAVILKLHHWRYYWRKLVHSVLRLEALSAAHAARVLAAGTFYHLTGRQLKVLWLGNETFQTRWLIGRELGRVGLVIQRELADSNPLTPAFLVSKDNR